jgi:excisionase family DNA binding protein
MGKKRRTEIVIETERLLLLRDASRSLFLWCDACRAEVRMLAPEEVASAAKVSVRTIYRWIEAEQLHFTETPGGELLICANSVPNQQST